MKKLKKGTFHLHGDKNGGHPSLIFEKNDKKNRYYAVCFTHKNDIHRTRLKHNIDVSDNSPCYVHDYPIMDKRKSFGSKELQGLRIHKEDKPLVARIKRKK